MSSGKTWLRKERLVVAGARFVPYSLLTRLETFARIGLGKGSGTGEVGQEVEVCLSMMPQGIDSFTALDIGANTGAWTSALLEKNHQVVVYSVEPSRQAYEALNLKFLGDERQTSVNLAFGAAPGWATLWADRAGSGLASLVRRDLAHLGLDFGFQESVEVESLDSWCVEAGVRPSLVKLDVEGFELEVIRGAKDASERVRSSV